MYFYQDKNHYAIGMDESSISIPSDPNNSDYQLVMKWVEQGNEIRPYIEVAKDPDPELTPLEKLSNLGLSVDDLKDLLGITTAS